MSPFAKTGTGHPPRRGILLAAALAVTTLALLGPASALATGQVGEPAADWLLQDTMDVWHTLSENQGNVVVLFMMGYG